MRWTRHASIGLALCGPALLPFLGACTPGEEPAGPTDVGGDETRAADDGVAVPDEAEGEAPDEGGGDGDGVADEAATAEDEASGDAADDGAADDAEATTCVADAECDDGIDCTVDSCSRATGTCAHLPDDDACDDGNACNGEETCDPSAGCRSGTPVDCGDGVACTEDSCDPLTGACYFLPDHGRCVAPQLCDPAAGGCVDPPACRTDAECDDGNGCNGSETCGPDGVCISGVPPDCADDVGCTIDRCNPLDGSCAHVPDDADCSDGSFCNGEERCDARRGCLPGAAPDCSDRIGCTSDRCDAARDACVHEPDDAPCDDAQFCDGAETCQAGTGCVDGTAPVCSDGLACTTDRCDPAAAGGAGACVYTPPDVDRDTYPDAACTGTDCNDANPSVNPGAVETCNAVDDDCDAATDEAFACARGASRGCTTACASTGTQACNSSCLWGACVPPAETCNGRDDDCDGATDNGFPCAVGASRGCTTSCASSGTQSCGAGCAWGACLPPAESCSGRDDDCDTQTDEGFACVAGTSRGCTTSCSTAGTETCSVVCAWGSCEPPAESCNERDDDCDTSTDEAFECRAGTPGPCTTGCGSAGSRTCSAACAWGVCVPPGETLNFADDDCDTQTDEGYSVVARGYDDCAGDSGSCPPGYAPRGSFKVDSIACGDPGSTGTSYDGYSLDAGWLVLCSPTDDVLLARGWDDCTATGGGCPAGYVDRGSFKVDTVDCAGAGPSGTDYSGYPLRSGWMHLCSRTSRESIQLGGDDCTGTPGGCPGGTSQHGTWKPDVVACNPTYPSAVTATGYPLNAGWVAYCVAD
jgi:hypothetical protein